MFCCVIFFSNLETHTHPWNHGMCRFFVIYVILFVLGSTFLFQNGRLRYFNWFWIADTSPCSVSSCRHFRWRGWCLLKIFELRCIRVTVLLALLVPLARLGSGLLHVSSRAVGIENATCRWAGPQSKEQMLWRRFWLGFARPSLLFCCGLGPTMGGLGLSFIQDSQVGPWCFGLTHYVVLGGKAWPWAGLWTFVLDCGPYFLFLYSFSFYNILRVSLLLLGKKKAKMGYLQQPSWHPSSTLGAWDEQKCSVGEVDLGKIPAC